MKKFAYFALVLLLSGCATAFPVSKEDSTYLKIVELPNQSKEVIFERSKQWIALTFKSAKAVVEYDSKSEGVIIGNGSMVRPLSSVNLTGGGMINYSMREDIKDGKIRLTFDRMTAQLAPSYNTITGASAGGTYPILVADLEGVKAHFDGLTTDLQNYIMQGKADNW